MMPWRTAASTTWSPMRARRVEGGRRRLRDVGDALAADAAHARFGQRQDVDAVERHLAAADAAAAAAIGEGGEADGRLAGAGFADQAEHAALLQREGDAVDDDDVARGLAGRMDGRLDLEVAHGQ